MNKGLIILPALSMLVLASCGGGEQKKEEELSTAANVKAVEVEKMDYEHWVELQGGLTTNDDVRLTPQMGGIIRSIRVKEGQKVKQGQIIAVMDSDIVSKNIEEVEAGLDNAEYVLNKQRELFMKGVGTEFDTTQAYNQVKSLRKKLETLKTQAGKSVVTAPFNGYVEEIFQKEGEVGAPQVPLCHIVGLKNIQATAQISETYVGNIVAGSAVRIDLPALDTTIKNEKVERVSKYINPSNRTYQIHIDLENKNETLIPNLLARIFVRDLYIKDATIIPAKSIQYNKEGETYVFTISEEGDKKVAHLHKVEVISSYKGLSAIKDGAVAPGDRIVTIGAEGIEDKTEVNLM